MPHVLVGGLLVVALLGLSGCQKLKMEKEFSLDALGYQEYGASGPTYNQKVEATLKASGPINAYLVLDDNLEVAKKAAMAGKAAPAEAVLDSKMGADDITLNGAIPAKKAFTVVMFSPNKAVTVKVTILGK
jgi:hypothetical protein